MGDSMTGRTGAAPPPARTQTAAARSERARARPREILDAARDVFARKGFEATRMDEVATAAGVTKPAVYRYFPGKDRLIAALLEEDLAIPFRQISAWTEAYTGPIEGLIEGFADRVGDMQSRGLTRGYLILALDESGRRPEIAAFIRDQILAPGMMVLARAFFLAMERGELSKGHDPAFMARMFFAPFLQSSLGAVGYALPVGDDVEQARYRRFHTAAFLQAFRA